MRVQGFNWHAHVENIGCGAFTGVGSVSTRTEHIFTFHSSYAKQQGQRQATPEGGFQQITFLS